MSYYRSIFFVPVFCYCHVFFCARTFIPIANWYISEYLPRLFYWNFNKVNIASVTNSKVVNRWNVLVTSNYFDIPFLLIIPIFFNCIEALA